MGNIQVFYSNPKDTYSTGLPIPQKTPFLCLFLWSTGYVAVPYIWVQGVTHNFFYLLLKTGLK